MALAAVAALTVLALCSAVVLSSTRDEAPDTEQASSKISPLVSAPSATTSSPEPSPSPDASEQGTGPKAFYADSRLALSPLIVHVREIPQALSALALPGAGSFRSLATVAEAWASDVATARDLVSRLPATAATPSWYARNLYETGALLYLEATRSIGLAAGSPSSSARIATAKAALRLLQLGDRVFDSAYRLLNQESALSTQEMIFPVTVPEFDAPATAPVYDTAETRAAKGAWVDQHADVLGSLRAQVASPKSSLSVKGMRAQVKALGTSVPAGAWGREGAVTLRLAALTVAESLSAAADLSAPLALIGQQLWRIGDDVLTQARETAVPGLSLTLPPAEQAVVRRSLYTGGVFNGTPPPLRPGENPGAGVPGGLPALNPLAILGGN